MSSVPVEMLTAVPVPACALESMVADDAVVVAPDLGAVKLAERYSALLRRPVAVVRKTRLSGAAVRAEELVGDVDGCAAVIVDDMMSTGSTIEVAVGVLRSHGARADVCVAAAAHGLLVGSARQRLAAAGITRLFVTDSLPIADDAALPVEAQSIAALVADAVGRLHRDDDLADFLGQHVTS